MNILPNLSIQIGEHIYLKNPDSSELGKKIITSSIDLIDKIGFDDFTFRKLAIEINSTEASIYRYFESKQKLLLYLSNWYWSWLDYRLLLATSNIPSAEDRLEKAIYLITEEKVEDTHFQNINEKKLHQIVISESLKSYLSRQVDVENKEGAFLPYKRLVQRIVEIIIEINPNYSYPHMLVSTVIEGSHLQRHFADHLQRLTNQLEGEDSIQVFYQQIVFKAIKN
tara:strand:+ start:237 stop:911 length:675 start_codon:yes stop_codon:yes gene_type:complete